MSLRELKNKGVGRLGYAKPAVTSRSPTFYPYVGEEELMDNQNINGSQFEGMVLGTAKPIPVPVDIIEVEVSIDQMVTNYGKAFLKEAQRKNPLMVDRVDLTVKEITDYCDYLLCMRVKSVHNECPDFRKLKLLYIPAYVQYCLTMIGEVHLRDRGLKLMPVFDQNKEVISFDEALQISEKIGLFVDDLCIVQDAMPRETQGNVDVMSTALIAGYMRSLAPVKHVAATYAAAFMNMKLKQETAFAALYRVQYDDIGYIVAALSTQKGLY